MLLHLHAAAQDLYEVRYYLALEYPAVISLEAVEYLAAHRHDALEFRVPRELAGAQGRVALDDVDLALRHVAAAAVHKLLDPVRDVHAAREFFLDGEPGLFGLLAAALVYEHLVGHPVRLGLVLDEIHLELGAQEVRHGLLYEAVRDGLLRLVLVGGLGRKAIRHEHEAVRHVLKADLRLVLLVFAGLFDVAVHRAHKGAARSLLRRASVLQEGAVVVILYGADLV